MCLADLLERLEVFRRRGELLGQRLGGHLFRLMLDTASGAKSKSERHGYGQSEFVPWYVGAVM